MKNPKRFDSVPMASDSADSSPSPNKRLKPLTLNPNQHESQEHQSSEQHSSMDGPVSLICGICLSDDEKAFRGIIDSCDHYFCFVCIMEWAKIESKCPMCKRRFSTIHRPPKQGIFPCERLVNVPIRDQVYNCYGNVTSGPFDPYAEVQCRLCHSATDESFLLLCDLCDSAAHTYCVGLGATVPEGDWFCHDCTLSRAEHTSGEIDTNCNNQTDEAQVSVSDTVQGWSHSNRFSSPISDGRGIRVANITGLAARPRQSVADKGTESTARTLHRCRNVHSHIRALRQNWDSLRNGSLRFSSSSVESGGKSSKEHNIGAALHDRSGQSSSSSSTSSRQSTTRNGFPGDTVHNRGAHDIDKAWKMLDIAKAKQRARESTNSSQQASKEPFCKRNASKESSDFLVSKRQQLGSNNQRCLEMEKKNRVATNTTLESSKDFPATRSPGFPSSRKIQTSIRGDVYHEKGSRLSKKNIHGASSNVTVQQNSLISLVVPVPGPADSFYAKPKLSTFSSFKVGIPEERVRSGKGCAESNTKKDGDAKSEIQSLVKLNLKLLSGHKQLGVDAFKEVARLATHSILAACGLEHPKAGVRSFPTSVCRHNEHIQQLHKSTLMPNSCRECFYIFVKDVVNSIMFEKVGYAKSC